MTESKECGGIADDDDGDDDDDRNLLTGSGALDRFLAVPGPQRRRAASLGRFDYS